MESIAIIGLGCMFPGASGPREFWQLLAQSKSAIRRIPASRWDADEYYDPDPAKATKTNSRYGGFVDAVEQFDADFFGISRAEATRMDPQQKLFLETAYQALENAGLPVKELGGTQTGVFAGISHSDHEQKLKSDLATIDAQLGVHSYHCFSANRISYHLNLQGPSLAVDTACSSGLVAVHLACQSLRAGECELALAGGVNAHLMPEESICTSMMGLLSGDGRCKSFDARADGFARSEGCGVVVLKRLADAQRDHDQVLALIRGSAVNHNGASNGITAPNGPSQQRVIARALQVAGVQPAEVSYIEAHATGTTIGDQVEMTAIQEVMSEGRAPNSPLLVGSVKTNIGHLEAAAGIAGLIKVVLSLGHESLPAMLNFEAPNPNLQLDGAPVALVLEPTAWVRDPQRPRIAGVSAFAFGGTNCHLVISEAGAGAPRSDSSSLLRNAPQIVTLSAKTKPALDALVQASAESLEQLEQAGESLADVCFSLNTGRTGYPFRTAVVGRSASELARALRGESQAGARFHARAGRLPPRVGVLSGWGAPAREQLARELLSVLPTARAASELEATSGSRLLLEASVLSLLRQLGIRPALVIARDELGARLASCASADDAVRAALEPSCVGTLASWTRPGVYDAVHAQGLKLELDATGLQGTSEEMPDPAALVELANSLKLDAVVAFGQPAGQLDVTTGDAPVRKLFWPFADAQTILGELSALTAALWVQGARVNYWVYDGGRAETRVLVPNYPFQKTLSWFIPSFQQARMGSLVSAL